MCVCVNDSFFYFLSIDEDGVVEKHNGKYVTAREYYCYKLQICPGIFNVLFYGGRLFQQIVVDIYMKIEGLRLDFFLRPETQKLIRADLYQGVVDTIASGGTRAAMAGKRIVLPASFTGGERDMKRRFFDAMALVQRYGKPCIFMTMTCNPHWEEIVRELAPGQSPQDRPDLVARVFRAKLRDIKELVIKKHYFGEVAAYVHVTEFQKRGLPHEHFLLIMKSGFKITSPDQYDAIISAELPDESKYRELHTGCQTYAPWSMWLTQKRQYMHGQWFLQISLPKTIFQCNSARKRLISYLQEEK